MNFTKYFLSAFFFAHAALGVQLHEASNTQILDELSRRLNAGSSTSNAIASYLCDSSYLKVSLIGNSSGNVSIYLGNTENCLEQAGPLNQYKSKIFAFTIAAICDSSYLKRFGLYPSGELKEIDSTYLGDYKKCMVQAKALNENRSPK